MISAETTSTLARFTTDVSLPTLIFFQMIDTVDLNDEKTRLYDLRNNLGAILANLKGSLCLDLRDEHFAASCRAIVKACRQVNS